ncbi:uncharacterized protein EKO05_0006641 [Ascochyta rabiei]|uniref:Uncharacterized protein n=1 Tax=Didymella rabiei TaxID=5454 RepID=A0A162W5P0_DIDRA|nr:uncharacterized protein EKO05_0006641 [Ascochyta rabiei]KZM18814.1 hypothetical protein ST47_g10001 [Ascochyta rabiei]UPX16230.1 hypothetical protein EKO05_0006641 [Ascochyta rabiei]
MSLRLPPVFTALQLPLLLLTNVFALAIGPRQRLLQLGLTLPVLLLLAAQSRYRDYAGPWGVHYGVNCGVASLIATYVDWVVLAAPDREGWVKLGRRDGGGERGSGGGVESNGIVKSSGVEREKRAAPTAFRERLWWAVRLGVTNRYTGWSCEVKNVPVEVDDEYPRWRFLIRKSLRAVVFYLAKDALYAYTASSPHGSWVDIVAIKPQHSYASYPFWHRFWFSWMQIVLTYVSLELYNTVVGIVSVAAGLARPSECPSSFGDLKGLWSVRRAWSVVWHQQCRRVCSGPAVFVVRDVLHLRKGSFASKYLQLFIGFGISGLVHGGASMLYHGSFEDDRAIKVFLAQAVIIFFEDHLFEFGKRLGFKDSLFWRLVGLVWTILAVGASMESWTGSLLKYGLWVHEREQDWFGIGPKISA